MTVLATTMVRRALRATGANPYYIFTNKYRTCRTVKMYGSTDVERNEKRIAAVKALNIPGLTVETRESHSYYGMNVSIIFRLPL
jgi:hypothetical protein